MSENAIVNGQSVKIGTCDDMYYLRIEDAHMAKSQPHNVNAMTTAGLRFRLPFPDEDDVPIGHYADCHRGVRLYKSESQPDGSEYASDYAPDWLQDAEPGSFQLTHPSGLLINVPCHHGAKLPEITGATVFWNGKSHSIELQQVKRLDDGSVVPVIGCRHCRTSWATTWDEVLDFVPDGKLRARLQRHIK